MAIHIKKKNRGKLHERLGIPLNQTIPLSRLASAKKSPDPSLREEANFAMVAKTKFHNKGKK